MYLERRRSAIHRGATRRVVTLPDFAHRDSAGPLLPVPTPLLLQGRVQPAGQLVYILPVHENAFFSADFFLKFGGCLSHGSFEKGVNQQHGLAANWSR